MSEAAHRCTLSGELPGLPLIRGKSPSGWPGAPGYPDWSGIPDDFPEKADGADGGKGFGAEPVHNLQVMIDVRACFQVKGAGELLDVGHVRQVRLLEPQDRERAAGPGVAAPPERHDLHRDPRQRGDLDEMIQLLTHDVPPAHRPAQRRLVHDRPDPRRVMVLEQVLALHPQADPAVDLIGGAARWPSTVTAHA